MALFGKTAAIRPLAFALGCGVFSLAIRAEPPSAPVRQDQNQAAKVVAAPAKPQTVVVTDPLLSIKIDDLTRRIDGIQTQSRDEGSFLTLGLTVITVLIAVIGLLFPAVSYFLSIRPAEKAIADANKAIATLDQRFSELLKKNRETEIDRALSAIADPSAVHVNLATATLTFALLSRAFSTRQIDELVNILRGMIRNDTRLQLMGLLVLSPQPSATQYIKDIALSDAFEQFPSPVLQYCAAVNEESLQALIKNKIIKSRNIESHLNNFANAAWSHSTEAANRYLNDKDFWRAVGPAARYNLIRNLRQQEGIKAIVEDTFLAQITSSQGQVVTLWKTQADGGAIEVTEPANADEIRLVSKDGSMQHVSKSDGRFETLKAEYKLDA